MAIGRRIPWPPTDLMLLEEIYRRYYREFENYEDDDNGGRDSKVYVPIDCATLGRHFNVDPDIVFGRLYNSLDRRFGLRHPDGSSTPFFALQVGGDFRAIHFPMLASVLADLRAERRRFVTSIWLSLVALAISIGSLAVGLI